MGRRSGWKAGRKGPLIKVMSDVFEYRVQARNPAMYVFFATAIAVTRFGMAHPGYKLIGIIGAAGLATVLWRLMLNPKSGFRLTDRMIEVFAPAWHRIVPLKQVESVLISGAERGQTQCLLRLKDGTDLPVPATSWFHANHLAQEFQAKGLRVLV